MLVEAPFVFFNNTGKVQRCMEAFNNGFHSYFSTLLCQDLFEFSVVDGKNVVQHSNGPLFKRPAWQTFANVWVRKKYMHAGVSIQNGTNCHSYYTYVLIYQFFIKNSYGKFLEIPCSQLQNKTWKKKWKYCKTHRTPICQHFRMIHYI